jgi:hypothetical protein
VAPTTHAWPMEWLDRQQSNSDAWPVRRRRWKTGPDWEGLRMSDRDSTVDRGRGGWASVLRKRATGHFQPK